MAARKPPTAGMADGSDGAATRGPIALLRLRPGLTTRRDHGLERRVRGCQCTIRAITARILLPLAVGLALVEASANLPFWHPKQDTFY